MTSYRGQGADSFSIGSAPPQVSWTVVRGDTAAFRVYVTDENRVPFTVDEWIISMDVIRPSSSNALIASLSPAPSVDDDEGEFTVSLSSGESEVLATNDIFDIQLSDATRTLTVCKGTITVIEDVTSAES